MHFNSQDDSLLIIYNKASIDIEKRNVSVGLILIPFPT